MFLKSKGLCLLILTVVLLCSGTSLSTIIGSSHDLSLLGGPPGHFHSSNEDEICIFCHTPHNAIVDDGDGNRLPLWNRNITRNTTGFSVYSSSTMNITMGQPKGYTLLCLSCHDGITALNALVQYNRHNPINMDLGGDQIGDAWYPGGAAGYPGMNIGGAYGTGSTADIKNLSDDHPVSFVFDAALVAADPKLKIPDATSKLKLFNGRLECPTCHNPHEEGGGYAVGTDAYEINKPFLRVTKDKSQICTDCHIK